MLKEKQQIMKTISYWLLPTYFITACNQFIKSENGTACNLILIIGLETQGVCITHIHAHTHKNAICNAVGIKEPETQRISIVHK